MTVAHSPATASVNKVIGKNVVTTFSVDCSLLGSAAFGLAQDTRAVRHSRVPETVKRDLERRKEVMNGIEEVSNCVENSLKTKSGFH